MAGGADSSNNLTFVTSPSGSESEIFLGFEGQHCVSCDKECVVALGPVAERGNTMANLAEYNG